MKIRTTEELQDKLDAEFAWRRKELTEIKSKIKQAKGHNVNTHLRIGVVMLYAHWEGFVKAICEYYLIYVRTKRLPFNELQNNFVAMEIKKMLEKGSISQLENCETSIVTFIRENLTTRSNIQVEIETKSNLNSEVLRNTLVLLGVDYSPYLTKEKLIDEKLLKNRNSIAHGNYLSIDKNDFNTLFEEVISIMNSLKDAITNNAALKKYKKENTV